MQLRFRYGVEVEESEQYFIVGSTGIIKGDWDELRPIDNERYEIGNYFHPQEEAESMAKKPRAVLKGADVIEMPIEDELDKVEYTPPEISESVNNADKGQVFSLGIMYGIRYLKSKIVK